MGRTASRVGPQTALYRGAGQPRQYIGRAGSHTAEWGNRRGAIKQKGGLPVKFARACGGFAAVLSVGFVVALGCEQLAALLDAVLMI